MGNTATVTSNTESKWLQRKGEGIFSQGAIQVATVLCYTTLGVVNFYV